VLDAQSNAIRGFDFADCKPVQGDSLRSPIQWKRSVGELKQQPVSLQFELRDARIYAFELHENGDTPAETLPLGT